MPNHHILYAGIYIIMMTLHLGTKKKSKKTSQNISREQRIILTYGTHTVESLGYHDTGNLLRDPYNHNPVVILDSEILKNWMTQDAYHIFETYRITGEFNYLAFAHVSSIKMYPIPYQTIGSDALLMPAFCLSSLQYADTGTIYHHVTAGISRYSFIHGANHHILLHESLKPIREENSND